MQTRSPPKTNGNPAPSDPDFVHATVTSAARDLGRFVGCRYRDAVLACISSEFDEVWDVASAENRDLALQQAIQARVVDAIEYCQA